MQSSLYDMVRVPPALAERMAHLQTGGPPGWRPSRLILQNYWLFAFEEFHFVHGRVVLRGANASGKSTVLASAITLLLDGEKRRERMDTFGGQGRSIAYYLVGDPKATPDSEFYADERTGYVALEFVHGQTGRHLTIGLGLYTSRSRPDLAVDAWGFAIRDGRRLGIDLHLHGGGAAPIPLNARQLREALGAGGTVVERVAEYQELVNRLLFGFESVEQYRFLLNILLQLRSPKLNKDIKPSDVCDLLTRSLPPLDDDLLDQVAQVIEDIDACLESLATTQAQLAAVQELDDALALYLNQRAQQEAWAYRQVHDDVSARSAEHQQVAARLANRRQELQELDQHLADIAAEGQAIVGRLQVLQQSQAWLNHQELAAQEADLGAAQRTLADGEAAVAAAAAALAELHAEQQRLVAEWEGEVRAQRAATADLAGEADAAAWSLAADRLDGVDQALARCRLTDDAAAEPVTVLTPDLLEFAGQERETIIGQVLARMGEAQAAAARYQLDQARLEAARSHLLQADGQLRQAERDLEEHRDQAVAGLHRWQQQCTSVTVPSPVLQQVAAAVYAYADPQQHPDVLLQPVAVVVDVERLRLDQEREALRLQQARLDEQQERLAEELQQWLARPEAEPPRRAGQAAARQLLGAHGIPAVPLYAACAAVDGVPAAIMAAIEENLDEAGLLDALIVPAGQVPAAGRLLGAAGLGDRWLCPAPLAAGRTLGDFLVPVAGAIPADDVRAVLRSVAVADDGGETPPTPPPPAGQQKRPPAGQQHQPPAGARLGAAGGWSVGLLSGTAARRSDVRVLYIGAANRRAERDRQVQRLQAEAARLAAQADEVASALRTLAVGLAELEQDLRHLRALPGWHTLQQAALAAAEAQKWVEQRQRELDQVDHQAGASHAQLVAARAAVTEALRPLPELQGRTAEGVRNVLEATRSVVRGVRMLAGHLRRLRPLRDRYRVNGDALAREQQRQQAAAAARATASQRVVQLTARRDALQERLAAAGIDVHQLLAESAELTRRQQEQVEQTLSAREARGRAQEAVERLLLDEQGLATQVAERQAELATVADRLGRCLAAYPTLAKALQLFHDASAGPLAAAEELLRLRRGMADELERLLAESEREAQRDLTSALYQHRSLLVDFAPALEAEFLYFQDQGVRLLPYQLRTHLDAHRSVQEQVLAEKENELYEDFVLKQVASAIRERIGRAEAWREEVNRLLGDRHLSNGEVLSISWRPLPPDRVTGAHTGRIVELLRRDVETLTDAEVRELTEHFRARVGEVREQERQSTLETNFADALRAVLDYRRWFMFTLYAKAPGLDRIEMTDTRFTARSGAEKSLAMFIPLLAAAHARFTSATADAPKLIGLDEAFAGVDDPNTREMFRFLVDLDFSWIMTSEKLWGVADTLPGCATYELVRRGRVVTPILYVWDGQARHGSLEIIAQAAAGAGARPAPAGQMASPPLAAVREVAAADERRRRR